MSSWVRIQNFASSQNFSKMAKRYSFVQSNRGKDKLILDGFVYRHERTKKENHYWVCEKHHCPGRAILRGAPSYNSIHGEVEVSRGHDHAAEEHREEVLRGTGAVLEAASSCTAHPSAIVQSTLEKIGRNVGPHLPSEDALKQRVRRRRRVSFPPEPLRRNGIRVPHALRVTIEGEGFLLFDTY